LSARSRGRLDLFELAFGPSSQYPGLMLAGLLVAISMFGQKPPASLMNSNQAKYSSIPAPLPMPTGGDAADILASKIEGHEADAGPALITAIQACGFSIIDHSRKVIVEPTAGTSCGLALEDYEVLSMLNLRQDTPGVKFKTMSDTLVVLGSPNQLQALHTDILSNWRAAMQSKKQSTAFFARFMDDLSAHCATPWSISGSTVVMGQTMPGTGSTYMTGTPLASTQNVPGRLAAIQAYATQIVTEFAAKAGNGNMTTQERVAAMQMLQPAQMLSSQTMLATLGSATGNTETRAFADNPLSMIQFVMLMRRFYADAFVTAHAGKPTLLASLQPYLADDRDYTGTLLDLGAASTSTIFNQAVATAENIGEGAAGKIDKANAIGAWAKMIATFMNLKVTLDPQTVAVQRRKDKVAGTPQNVTATVAIDFPSNANPNGARATRIMSWGLGADLSPPDNGAAAGAQVTWHLDEAGSVLDHASQFVSPGQAGDGQIKITDQTDKDGKVKIGIQGTPQKSELPANSIPYDRYARLEVEVNLKGANLYQDVVDAMSAVATGATGNLPGLLKTVLPDMLNRTSLFSTKFFPVTIHDWTPPLYEGTFSLEIKGSGKYTGKDDVTSWGINRRATGKIYSVFRGFNIRDTLLVEGRGAYYFQVESLHDVDVKDSYMHSYLAGDDCGGRVSNVEESLSVTGPVANLGYPYTLQSGGLTLKSQHVDGKDSMLIEAQTSWSLPCHYVFTKTMEPNQSGIQNMDIPIKFTDTQVPHPQGLNGTGIQKMTIALGGVNGEVTATMKWELHKVNPPAPAK